MRYFQVDFVCYRLMAILLVFSALMLAENTPPPRISKETREEIIQAFNAELVYIRTSFPMGKTGLKLKNGAVTPSGPELQRLMALWGPAAKPGDRARISDIVIKEDHIRFEINGGPIKKQKWYQRIEISGVEWADCALGSLRQPPRLFRGSLLRQVCSGGDRARAEGVAASGV